MSQLFARGSQSIGVSALASVLDYAKAFDCVDHNKLWKILKEMGISDHLTCLLRNLYAGQEPTVRTGHGTTDWFLIFNLGLYSSSSSVTQSCPTLCNPMNRSTPGLPVHHQLPEFNQTHAHRVSDAIQPSHPLLSPLLQPPIPPSIRVFSNESTLGVRWPKYWSFSFSISPSNEVIMVV